LQYSRTGVPAKKKCLIAIRTFSHYKAEAKHLGNHDVYHAACSCLADWLTVMLNTHYQNILEDIPDFVEKYTEAIEVLELQASQSPPESASKPVTQPITLSTGANTATQTPHSADSVNISANQGNFSHSTSSMAATSPAKRTFDLFSHASTSGDQVSISNNQASASPSCDNSAPVRSATISGSVDEELMRRVARWECNLENRSVLPWESFSDIGNVKGEIEKFFKLTTKWKGEDLDFESVGTILYGPGGTGKTSFVQSLAKKFDVPLFNIGANHLKDKLVGVTEK
jgi:ATPase family associated with various cellular activities (AAA)